MSAVAGDAVRVIVFVDVAGDGVGAQAGADLAGPAEHVPARPLFPGHEPPTLRGAAGQADRHDADAAAGRAAIACRHGVHAFCHDVRSAGDAQHVASEVTRGDPAMPFCIRWAGEPATRDARVAGDQVRAIDLCVRLFGDPRYVRVGGRPLLVVRHAASVDAAGAAAWRDASLRAALAPPYVVACESPGDGDPVPPGCDAWAELPPFLDRVATLNPHVAGLDAAFTGRVASYRAQVLLALRRDTDGTRRFRGVFPGWDDTPVRGMQGTVFIGSSPELFGFWVEAMVRETRRRFDGDERLLFVNAWNDRLHGCALAPDRSHGAQYLEALRDGIASGERLPVVSFVRPPAAALARDLERAIDTGELAITTFGTRPPVDAPGVSVVMPAYNHARFLARTLASLAAQTALPRELVAVDDGSTDASAAAIERFAQAAPFPVTLARQPNRGAHVALNRGLALARGRVVALLNSDDAFHPRRLERLAAALDEVTGFAFSDTELIDDDDRPVTGSDGAAFHAALAWANAHPSLVEALLARNTAVSTGNFVFRRTLLDAIGGFAALEVCHDWDFLLAATLHTRVVRIAEPLYRYRLHAGNTFASRGLVALQEADRVLRLYLAALRAPGRLDDATRDRIRGQLAARGQAHLWRA